MLEAQQSVEASVNEALQPDQFAALLNQEFSLEKRSDDHRARVRTAVRTLAEQVLDDSSIVSSDVVHSIEALIAEIDSKLSAQINQILHHDEFQKLEGAWRGLSHLVTNTETDTMLKIRILDISKRDLHRNLRKFKGTAWDQSPIFKKMYEEEYGQFGGQPFGCIVGDYHFDHSASDVELLREMSKISASAHCPFIAGVAPSTLQMDSWQELSNPRDLKKVFDTPEYAAWRSLRQSDDSRYVGLAMPRFLARLPYGAKTDPVDEFNFEEETEGGDSDKYSWANSAYAMATNITRAFKHYGWCARIRGIESGGVVENLPVHTFPTEDGGVAMKCPTEIAITDRREKELADIGLMPLLHKKNEDLAAFIGAQSLHLPAQYEGRDGKMATANANLSARLPYMFAVSRFAHYLKCMGRDKVGSFTSRDELQRWLSDWIHNYIDFDPTRSSDADKARKPLVEASIEVVEDEENPGYYKATFLLKPHYQFEGMTVSLRLASRINKE